MGYAHVSHSNFNYKWLQRGLKMWQMENISFGDSFAKSRVFNNLYGAYLWQMPSCGAGWFRCKSPDEGRRPLHENTVCNPKTQPCPSEHRSLCRTFICLKCFCVFLHMRIKTAWMQKTLNRNSYKYVCAKHSARWRQEDGGVRAQRLPTRSTYSQFVAEADKICFASIECSGRFEWNVMTIQCKSRIGNVNLLRTPDGESGHHKVIRICRAEMSTFLFNSCRDTSVRAKVVKQSLKISSSVQQGPWLVRLFHAYCCAQTVSCAPTTKLNASLKQVPEKKT